MADKNSYVVISYIPLLTGQPGTFFQSGPDALEELQDYINTLPDGEVRACMWVEHDGVPSPVFVLEHADAIREHLVAWTEEKPSEWFSLALVHRKPNTYALALMPNLEKSLERWKIAFQLSTGFPPAPGEFRFFFKPLHFMTGAGESYMKLRKRVPRSMNVGFLDVKDVPADPKETDINKIQFVGPFTVSRGKYDEYLLGLIANMSPPA